MSQDYYAGVPALITVNITNAEGAAFDLNTVSASYGNNGGGVPHIVAMTSSETGTYTATITPPAQGTLNVWVYGYDSTPTLQVVGRLQVLVLGTPAI